jgi:hypothetical protein
MSWNLESLDLSQYTTIDAHIRAEQRLHEGARGHLSAILHEFANMGVAVSQIMSRGKLHRVPSSDLGTNVQRVSDIIG